MLGRGHCCPQGEGAALSTWCWVSLGCDDPHLVEPIGSTWILGLEMQLHSEGLHNRAFVGGVAP